MERGGGGRPGRGCRRGRRCPRGRRRSSAPAAAAGRARPGERAGGGSDACRPRGLVLSRRTAARSGCSARAGSGRPGRGRLLPRRQLVEQAKQLACRIAVMRRPPRTMARHERERLSVASRRLRKRLAGPQRCDSGRRERTSERTSQERAHGFLLLRPIGHRQRAFVLAGFGGGGRRAPGRPRSGRGRTARRCACARAAGPGWAAGGAACGRSPARRCRRGRGAMRATTSYWPSCCSCSPLMPGSSPGEQLGVVGRLLRRRQGCGH